MSLVNAIRSSNVSTIDMFTANKGNNKKETVKEIFPPVRLDFSK